MATNSPQIIFRLKGQTTCLLHKGRPLELFCRSCDQVACIKCVSSVHQSHTICDLADISLPKKIKIQEFISKTEDAELAQTEKHIKSTKILIRDNSIHFQKVEYELIEQHDKVKQDLDLLLAEKLSLYQQMANNNNVLLNAHKSNLRSYKAQVNKLLEECKSALQGGTDLEIYDTDCEIQSVPQPKEPTLGVSSFTSNTTPRGYLEQALGTVTMSDPQQVSADHDRSVGSPCHRGPSSTQQRSASDDGRPVTCPPSQYTLLPQTKVLGEFATPCPISSLCPTSDGGTWVCHCISFTLTLLDRQGTPQREIKYKHSIRDINLSHNTDNLWSCHWENNSIMELVSGKPTLRFKVNKEGKPQCICITGDGHIIVGMEKNISKFTKKGKVVLSTTAAWAGKPLASSPYRITECHVTGNVAVADRDYGSGGGEWKPHVLVMDNNFRELFRYRGAIPRSSQQTTKAMSYSFNPNTLVYDSVGNLVIEDCKNSRVLLISGRGVFLRTIHTDIEEIWAVGIDRRDVVWAAFGDNVKLLQYTSV